MAIATAVRRYKSENGLSLGGELARLQIATEDATLADSLRASATDLRSVTRAATIEVGGRLDPGALRAVGWGAPARRDSTVRRRFT